MAENIFSTFDISGQGMSVQRMRLSAVSRNIANVNTTKSTDGRPYQREVVVVRPIKANPFDSELDGQIEMYRTDGNHSSNLNSATNSPDNKILDARTVRDATPPRLVYDPHHPDANPEGYVEMPNINIVTEMVEMITAQRSFEANTGVVESAKNLARYSLEI
jgi:flagellar basal-body rod protein FlgC